MTYYNKRRGKNNYSIGGYCPSATYKNKKPTKAEFNIQSIDIEEIEKERYAFEKKKDKGGICLWLWFMGGLMVPILILDLIGYNIDKENPLITSIVCLGVYIFGFYIISKLTTDRPFPKEEVFNRIKNYKTACKEYEWWQERKKKDFWYSLDGHAFEQEIAKLFKKDGFATKVSKVGADGGVDIIVSKNNKRYAVQCKAHTSKISEGVARDLYGVLHSRNFDGGYLVTLNGTSAKTKDFCKKNKDKPITIWTIEDILKRVK